jgi:hypothetical protein
MGFVEASHHDRRNPFPLDSNSKRHIKISEFCLNSRVWRELSSGRAQGPCYLPMVLSDVSAEMRIYHEESLRKSFLYRSGPVEGIEMTTPRFLCGTSMESFQLPSNIVRLLFVVLLTVSYAYAQQAAPSSEGGGVYFDRLGCCQNRVHQLVVTKDATNLSCEEGTYR